MTHDDLVKSAFSWLKNKKSCSIVASELVTGGMETPDAIGWNGWVSTIIEAKVSVSDFRADQKKVFRKVDGRGMGIYRYYIIPVDLQDKIIPILPDGWGLLLRTPHRKVMVHRGSRVFENDKPMEILYLSSVIRRIALKEEPLKGINVRCYTYQVETEPKAELFVEPGTLEESLCASSI